MIATVLLWAAFISLYWPNFCKSKLLLYGCLNNLDNIPYPVLLIIIVLLCDYNDECPMLLCINSCATFKWKYREGNIFKTKIGLYLSCPQRMCFLKIRWTSAKKPEISKTPNGLCLVQTCNVFLSVFCLCWLPLIIKSGKSRPVQNMGTPLSSVSQ